MSKTYYVIERSCPNDDAFLLGTPFETVTRRNERAALYALEMAVYNAAKDQALLDRMTAVRAMGKARAWAKTRPITHIVFGHQRITITTFRTGE